LGGGSSAYRRWNSGLVYSRDISREICGGKVALVQDFLPVSMIPPELHAYVPLTPLLSEGPHRP